MTREPQLGTDEWRRLEELWEIARALPAEKQHALLESLTSESEVRSELKSLLSDSDASEAFFNRLLAALPDAARLDFSRTGDTPTISCGDLLVGAMVGQYQIESLLGEGGMGLVYLATDTRLRRRVALKVLRDRAGGDTRAKDRLLAEARAAAALDHPNICTVHEVGETADHVWFIAMAYYAGETLDRLLRRGPVPLSLVLDYAAQIARGLGAAHERGIVHSDVKPANIIVTTDGVLKLLDFGIARRLDDHVSFGDMTPGTIAYMSPEQVTSGPIDRRTDLWAFGVVLYELCLGARPFNGADGAATARAILHDTPPLVTSVRPELPSFIDAIVGDLLAKDLRQRYGSTAEVLADLSRSTAAGGPATVAARRPQAVTRRLTRAAIAAIVLLWPWTSASDAPYARTPAVSDRRMAAVDLFNQAHVDVLFRSDSGRERIRDLVRRAIAIDSTYAPAHASLAHMLASIPREGRDGHPIEHLAEAERHARTAIALDSSLSFAHSALGHVLLNDYRLAQAETSLIRAIKLRPALPRVFIPGGRPEHPGEFLVELYVFLERPSEALRYAEMNVTDTPDATIAHAELARALVVNGRCDEAKRVLDRLAGLQPPPARTPAIAAQCYAQRQMWQNAIDELRPAAKRNPGPPEAWLAFMLARGGQVDEARQIRDRLLERHHREGSGAFGLATVYAGFREFEQAFTWLDRAIDDRSLTFSIMEPAFDELRRDPRFDQVRRRLGLRAKSP
jgi:serine/threonine-protein kinase